MLPNCLTILSQDDVMNLALKNSLKINSCTVLFNLKVFRALHAFLYKWMKKL